MILLHHSESADPTLLVWMRERIDAILGFRPATIVIVLGVVIVALPLLVAVRVVLQRRSGRH